MKDGIHQTTPDSSFIPHPSSLPSSPFLYPILDSVFSSNLAKDAEEVIRAGAKIFQLRAKTLSKRTLFEIVYELEPLCRDKKVCMIVNDHVDVVMVSEACGVHVGQGDFPVMEARTLLPGRIIGLSTHNLEQFSNALKLPVDYVAVGPIYETSTKAAVGAALGVSFLQKVRTTTQRPLVCIGGIRRAHLRELIAVGADGVAFISELYSGKSVYDSMCRLIETI